MSVNPYMMTRQAVLLSKEEDIMTERKTHFEELRNGGNENNAEGSKDNKFCLECKV